MKQEIERLQGLLGKKLFDWQLAAVESAAEQLHKQRLCLYYKTGSGKSITALACMSLWGVSEVLVVTPPSTFKQWIQLGETLGIEVEPMSHAKFRMESTKLSRKKAIVADEIHLFGGHSGKGWKKLDQIARSLEAPLVMASATPNYNDADRVYCIQHILDPASCKGGFLEFLYAHCITEQNPFGMMPNVTGFQRFPGAAAYLAALPRVEYLPDDLVYKISDVWVNTPLPADFEVFGYDARRHRIMASQIEDKHARVFLGLVDEDGFIHRHVYDELTELVGAATTPVLIYADHSTVADALGLTLHKHLVKHAVVTGSTPAKKKQAYIDAFKDGVLDVLVGTASLATGTDGMDKMCDYLIILDDTNDDSLRRQLVGRIMPRGEDADASGKQVWRVSLS